MSRSSNVLLNPCMKYLRWDSTKACFTAYNKEAKEEELYQLPFEFAVLDVLSGIGGYSEKLKTGMWSTEVKRIKEQEMTVRTSAGELTSGLYSDIKDEIKALGGKYIASVYIGVDAPIENGSELQIWNIQFRGSGFEGWNEFTRKNKKKLYTAAVSCNGYADKRKGSNVYTIPTFGFSPITDEQNEQLKKLDLNLQEYLSYYLKNSKQAVEQATPAIVSNKAEIDDSEEEIDPDYS